MKSLIITISAFLLVFPLIAQEESGSTTKSKGFTTTHFGFTLGANYSQLFMDEEPEDLVTSSGVRIRLGIFMEFHLNDKWAIVPKLELSGNKNEFRYEDNLGWTHKYHVHPWALQVIGHLRFAPWEKAPYFVLGPNLRIPITNESYNTTTYSSRTDIAVDFGIGWKQSFTKFNFMPELRYTYGFMDVNNNPAYPAMTLHQISLVLQFAD